MIDAGGGRAKYRAARDTREMSLPSLEGGLFVRQHSLAYVYADFDTTP